MIAQKLSLRISPPKLPCPGTAPVAAINLKFLGNMPRLCQYPGVSLMPCSCVRQVDTHSRPAAVTDEQREAWRAARRQKLAERILRGRQGSTAAGSTAAACLGMDPEKKRGAAPSRPRAVPSRLLQSKPAAAADAAAAPPAPTAPPATAAAAAATAAAPPAAAAATTAAAPPAAAAATTAATAAAPTPTAPATAPPAAATAAAPPAPAAASAAGPARRAASTKPQSNSTRKPFTAAPRPTPQGPAPAVGGIRLNKAAQRRLTLVLARRQQAERDAQRRSTLAAAARPTVRRQTFACSRPSLGPTRHVPHTAAARRSPTAPTRRSPRTAAGSAAPRVTAVKTGLSKQRLAALARPKQPVQKVPTPRRAARVVKPVQRRPPAAPSAGGLLAPPTGLPSTMRRSLSAMHRSRSTSDRGAAVHRPAARRRVTSVAAVPPKDQMEAAAALATG